MNDERVSTKDSVIIIEASPILIGRKGPPTRIVLYRDLDTQQYVTHKECLTSDVPDKGTSCKFIHHSFEDGSYFPFKCAIRPSASMSELEARHYAEENYRERTKRLFNVGF